LNGKACNITGGRETFHCRVSAAECSKGRGSFEVLNNKSVKIFEGTVTRAEELFRIIN
jgi:hypothetical protein